MRISPIPIILCLVFIAGVAVILFRWTGAQKTKPSQTSDLQPGPIQHTELSADLDRRIRRFEPIFAEVYPRSHEEWLDGFKRDLNPEPEIAIWETMATSYSSFITKYSLNLDAKKEALGILLIRSSADEATTLSSVKLHYLSQAQAIELVRSYSDTPKPIQVLTK